MIYDSDFTISLSHAVEFTHARAKAMYEHIADCEVHMLRLVRYEIATVLSRKYGYRRAYDVLADLEVMPIVWVSSEAHEKEIWQEFFRYTQRGVSFTDCANIVAARRFGLKIASFDAFYPEELLVTDKVVV